MIDHSARKQLAKALRDYVGKRITSDDLDGLDLVSDDPAVHAVLEWAWTQHGDDGTVADGRNALSKSQKHAFARAILFLKSDEPYQYPPQNAAGWSLALFFQPLLSLLTFGRFSQWVRKQERVYENAGDISVWPFVSRKQLARISAELARP